MKKLGINKVRTGCKDCYPQIFSIILCTFKATLSGTIDVIMVKGKDGIIGSSPFHVRFGKFKLLKPETKYVSNTQIMETIKRISFS